MAVTPELKPYQIPEQWKQNGNLWKYADEIKGDNSNDSTLNLKQCDSDIC